MLINALAVEKLKIFETILSKRIVVTWALGDLGLQGGPLSALDSVDTGEGASSAHCTLGSFSQGSLSKHLPRQTVWKVRVV